MSNSQSFYLDKEHSRSILLEWSDDFNVLNVHDDTELIHQHKNLNQLKKGIALPTPKGDYLYIRLFTSPTRWEVRLGNRFLINAYNHSKTVLKNSSQIFYYIFLASLMYLIVLLLPMYQLGQLTTKDLFTPIMILYFITLIVFYLTGYFVKRGKPGWFYVGAIIYVMDTIVVFINLFGQQKISLEFFTRNTTGYLFLGILLIRLLFAYQLVSAFKHVVAVQKQQPLLRKESNEEILDQ